MSHDIKERDIQAGIAQAWHNLTTVVDKVTRKIAMPFEARPHQLYYAEGLKQATSPDDFVPANGYRLLIADDDNLPIAEAYNAETYCPTTIGAFWDLIERGMGDTPYEVVSAGTVDNRRKLFASIKVSDGFKIGEREFKDFITLQDSFDKSMSCQLRYSSICTVCHNTFKANLSAGTKISSAKHSKGFEGKLEMMADALDAFAGTSAQFEAALREANEQKATEDEARAWIAGVDANGSAKKMNSSDVQRVARMTELFRRGKGNAGETRLDAFSGVTDFHTHESSSRVTRANAQWINSEFGSSQKAKEIALSSLNGAAWEKAVEVGSRRLAAVGV